MVMSVRSTAVAMDAAPQNKPQGRSHG
jgi:hypothetical protein